ncbi:3-beta hydroxysteroid dehydrogenase [Curtobacterium sp. MCBA15_009]|uniref:NAD-dependent epimerase/dehydratase family protein n=1 Tax=Curtobacterium sp. MCBA15_009 TaxID=1898737 RepID=UPI0008DDA4EE|nr:NAD-dependent epimerase/dehydratase family protein [Curtobacterium sp. MCBA15_009]OII10973.1 3-beta hydroxysteroid dehydrogenase [Curtobacterium sp. MCBA15_009]
MHVFVTGASGWIGSHTVDDLLAAGHTVSGLARSDASATALEAKGVAVVRGGLDDLDVLAGAAAAADGVLHLANKHDWSDPVGTNAAERAAVEALAGALVGTDRPLVVASGVAGLAQGRPSTEADANPFVGPDTMRGGSENRGFDFVDQGVRAIAARFSPTTHGTGDHGFIAEIVAAARRSGVSGYIGDGTNSWAAVHVTDAARVVRLGLEQAPAGTRVHAVAETAIPTRQIAEAIGAGLGLPVTSIDPADADAHFGFIARFFGMEMSATSEATRALLGWEPTGPGLLEDIAAGAYSEPRVA